MERKERGKNGEREEGKKVAVEMNVVHSGLYEINNINNHFISDCTREVWTKVSRGKCTCFIQYYRNSLNVARVRVCSGHIVYIYI